MLSNNKIHDKSLDNSEKLVSVEEWEDYNCKGTAVDVISDAKHYSYDSYSHYFFKIWPLKNYLNMDCGNLLQFGSSNGNFLKDYQFAWNVKAYEYSPAAVATLRSRNIPVNQIDLNSIDKDINLLAYRSQLSDDLSAPTNILAIRILEYLSHEALCLLLVDLMNLSKPNSVFFLGGSLTPEEELTQSKHSLKTSKNYITSFFAPRTDMEFLLLRTSPLTKAPKPGDHIDQMLVCRKL